jgi:hypothetical protein
LEWNSPTDRKQFTAPILSSGDPQQRAGIVHRYKQGTMPDEAITYWWESSRTVLHYFFSLALPLFSRSHVFQAESYVAAGNIAVLTGR